MLNVIAIPRYITHDNNVDIYKVKKYSITASSEKFDMINMFKDPLFNGLDFDGYCVAGGSVYDHLFTGNYPKDIDIFLYETRIPAEQVLIGLLNCLTKNYYIIYSTYPTMIKTTNCIKIIMRLEDKIKCNIDIVLSLFPTKISVIDHFDLAPSMFLFDGQKIYANDLGMSFYKTFTFEPLYHKVSDTIGTRIEKYVNRKNAILDLSNAPKKVKDMIRDDGHLKTKYLIYSQGTIKGRFLIGKNNDGYDDMNGLNSRNHALILKYCHQHPERLIFLSLDLIKEYEEIRRNKTALSYIVISASEKIANVFHYENMITKVVKYSPETHAKLFHTKSITVSEFYE
jgi:hypothetical protein